MKRGWPLVLTVLLAPTVVCSAGCQRSLATCDITQSACQQDIYFHVLSLRGDGYDPYGGLPPVKVISEDAYRQQLEQDQADSAKAGPNPWDEALALLHFNPPTTPPTTSPGSQPDGGTASDAGSSTSAIDDQVTHVYAFYDPTAKNVTVIDHSGHTGNTDPTIPMISLAHELVHSLQNRELDLTRNDFHTSDEYFSYDTIVEGDARFYEYLFENDLKHLGYSQSNVDSMPDQELRYEYDNIDQLGWPLFAARALIYGLGAKYEATAYRGGGNAAVRHAYAKAPGRMVGFLVGPDGHAPAVGSGQVCRASRVQSLPAPTNPDQFGALLLYTFLRGWGVDHSVAFPTAQAWTGDYMGVQANADVSVVAVAWRIELSIPPPAQVVQALTATKELAVTPAGNSLEITVSNAATPMLWQAQSCQ